jgi:hypothetical protein
MHGPGIFVNTVDETRIVDRSGNKWQYHSRSDRHSKAACWGVLFDLLVNCPLLRKHAAERRVVFGINHEMRDFRQNRKKNLDLVICTPKAPVSDSKEDFDWLKNEYEIMLTSQQEQILSSLPVFMMGAVGSVLVALEAKACMTEHGKARPRLYDELSSSHLTIHGDTEKAIAAGFISINTSTTFVSPTNQGSRKSGKLRVNEHNQPKSTIDVVKKIEELSRRSTTDDTGYDAIGVVLIDCRNDGSKVRLIEDEKSEYGVPEILRYESMIQRISNMYSTRFAAV